MSTTYPDLPNTNYPDAVDSWARMQDISASDVALTKQYQAYIDSGDVVSAQNIINNNPTLITKIINATNINNIGDAIKALERFFNSNVNGYIQTKQSEFQGEIDKFTDRDVYNSSTQYYAKNFVHYNSEVYIALKNNLNITPIDNGIDWTKLSIKGNTGDKGDNGANFVNRKEYDNATPYVINDLVKYNTTWYYCILDTTGHIPTNTTYWAIFLESLNAVANAGDVSIADSGSEFTSTNVEDALQEIVGSGRTTETVKGNSDKITILNTQELESTGYGIISGLTVTAQATPDMTVNVTGGVVHMANGDRLTPVDNNALAVTLADATNPRIDIIYINPDGTIGYTAGTPATTPIAPSIPVGAFLLYQINVGTGVTSITNANITDMRKMKNTTDNLKTEVESHKAENAIQTAGGTATAITITTGGNFAYTQGNPLKFKAIADNGTVATTINIDGKGAKNIKKLDGSVPTIKNGKVYEIYYDVTGDCFFYVPKASGTAINTDVRLGKNFSNDDDSEIPGALDLSLLTADNIRDGVIIDGITGVLEEKQSIDVFLQNLPSNYSPLNFEDGVGLWATPTTANGKVSCFNSSGTIISTITCGYASTSTFIASYVGKSYIFWRPYNTIAHGYITDKSGNPVHDFPYVTYNGAINEYSQIVFMQQADYKLYVYTITGTLIGSVALTTPCTMIVPIINGCLCASTSSNATLHFINNSAVDKVFTSLSFGSLQLFANTFKMK